MRALHNFSVFIVMDYYEHDLKWLLANMPNPFHPSEVKTLMHQLISAMDHLHSSWIVHRDIKTANLLLSNKGEIKVADFGLARVLGHTSPKFSASGTVLGDPATEDTVLTRQVVTLWYRAPEVLLSGRHYTSKIDMWSIGCVFAELLRRKPLFPAQGDLEMVRLVFNICGRPPPNSWLRKLAAGASTPSLSSPTPLSSESSTSTLATGASGASSNIPMVAPNNMSMINFDRFPADSSMQATIHRLRNVSGLSAMSPCGIDLLARLLAPEPSTRITARIALKHEYFVSCVYIVFSLLISNVLNFTFSQRVAARKRSISIPNI
jgi:serine/threonine protein kinase